MSSVDRKEILLVNLTRMGDLIQTTPVMAGLKGSFPGARITLLVASEFREICKDLPFIDRLLTYDKAAFRKIVGGEGHSLVDGYRSLEAFIDGVNDTAYDLAINFTPSGESALLTSLFRAQEVRGVTAGADGARVIRHPWQRYFMNVIPSRRYNPFHLCDMMVKAAGIPPSGKGLHLRVSEEEGRKSRELLREKGVSPDDLLIGFQLGASHDLKTWPAASFARLADRFAQSLGARILLTGSKSEEKLGKEFESLAAAKAVNLIGRTDLRGAAALLERCALLVTNDTGPLHIATAVGTRAIDLSLGHVCFRETGPYGEGHYVIEADLSCGPCGFHVKCTNPRCKERITPDCVFELGSRILANGAVDALDDGPAWEGVRIFRSGFSRDGLQDFVPLIRRPLSEETFYTYLYRETWPHVLDGSGRFSVEEACRAVEDKVAAWHGPAGLVGILREAGEELAILRRMEALAGEALARVSLIAREAAKPSPDTEWIRRTWKDIPVIDREIETLGRTHPPFMPPVVLFGFGKEALEGKELSPMAETALGLYADRRMHFSMLAETMERLTEKQVKAKNGSCNT